MAPSNNHEGGSNEQRTINTYIICRGDVARHGYNDKKRKKCGAVLRRESECQLADCGIEYCSYMDMGTIAVCLHRKGLHLRARGPFLVPGAECLMLDDFYSVRQAYPAPDASGDHIIRIHAG